MWLLIVSSRSRNALLHAGFQVSRSHALPGSLKTTATRQDIHDVFRNWVKTHPVKAESISPTSPAHYLHSKDPRYVPLDLIV